MFVNAKLLGVMGDDSVSGSFLANTGCGVQTLSLSVSFGGGRSTPAQKLLHLAGNSFGCSASFFLDGGFVCSVTSSSDFVARLTVFEEIWFLNLFQSVISVLVSPFAFGFSRSDLFDPDFLRTPLKDLLFFSSLGFSEAFVVDGALTLR